MEVSAPGIVTDSREVQYANTQMGDYIPTDDELAEFRKNLKY